MAMSHVTRERVIVYNHDAAGTGWRRRLDALSCKSLSAKEPLIVGLFYGT